MKKILSTRVLVKICVLTTILLVLIIYTIWGNSALCKSDTCAIRKLEKADGMRSLEILTILTINAELPHIV